MINISHRKRKGENIFRDTATVNKKMCFPNQKEDGRFDSNFESVSDGNFNSNESHFPQVTSFKSSQCLQCQAGQPGHINHLMGS